MDVRKNTSLSDGSLAEELVQLLVIADGELKVPGDDPGPSVVLGGISRELEKLSGQLLEDGGHVDRRPGSEPLRVSSGPQIPGDTADGELESGSG